MSVEQTTQLIQLILNSVLLSVACALVLGGLTARHAAIAQELQDCHRRDQTPIDGQESRVGATQFARGRFNRKQMQQLRFRYQICRYSVLTAYYALFFAGLSCFALVIRGLVEWNGLIPIALGLFVIGVATLLVGVGLTLLDWHLGDRALIDDAQQFLSFGTPAYLAPFKPRQRRSAALANRRERSRMRVS